jgi:hypothetical protein
MAVVASRGQFAIAAWAVGFHLNVQHGIVDTTSCDAKGLVFAVVNCWAHEISFSISQFIALALCTANTLEFAALLDVHQCEGCWTCLR